MNYKEAINASQIWAARGYNDKGVCEAAICHYGDKLMWLPGFAGNWAKKWEALEDEADEDVLAENYRKLSTLDFYPTGPKPEDQVQAELMEALGEAPPKPTNQIPDEEMRAALEEIADEYEWADSLRDDYFEPMGETYD